MTERKTALTNIRGPIGPQGIAGPGAIPADEAVAGYVQLESVTRTALLNDFTRRTVINVLDYGAVGDWDEVGQLGTDNWAAFKAAADELLVADQPTKLVVPPGDYWMSKSLEIDGEDVELEIMPGATIRTTATQYGHTIAFMGNGIIGDGSAGANAVLVPQRHRFAAYGGGSIVGVGGAFENALGVVRVKNAHISDLTLEADQHAFAAQYGIDNLRIERVEVVRAGGDGFNILAGINRLSIRDCHVVEANRGVGITAATSASDQRVTDVLIDGLVTESITTWAVSVSFADRVAIRGGMLRGASGSLTATKVTDLAIAPDAGLPNGVNWGAEISQKLPLLRPLTLSSSWVAFGAPYATPGARLENGMVHLEGSIKSGTMTAGTILAIVPYGWRPTGQHRFIIPCPTSTGGVADVYVVENGNLMLATAITANILLSLDGIRFPAGATPA